MEEISYLCRTQITKNENKKAIYIIGSIVLLVLIGSIACVFLLFSTPLKIEKATYLYIDNDDNIDSVYTKLKKIVKHPALPGCI